MKKTMGLPGAVGLYDPSCEHDSCGVGFVVNINGYKSHEIIEKGIEVLNNLLHRGASGADENTGDGAGLLFQLPDLFFRREASRLKIELPKGDYGVGMCFLPMEVGKRRHCMNFALDTASEEKLTLLGWREVPVEPSVLGVQARNEMPSIWQCFLASDHVKGDDFERKIYIFRKQWAKKVESSLGKLDDFYICSCSSRTIVYKGLMQAPQVPAFYSDLRDKDLQSALVVVHQRFSTNTFPCWKLAQPFRLLAHNGEINTINGNRKNTLSREKNINSDLFGEDISKIFPIIEAGGSDSASLDNLLEILNLGGREIHHSMVMMIPQGWGAKYPMGPDLRGFFDYHAGIMEPWDGPAAVAFTDGRYIGGLLDRNGLRPARYTITNDGLMVFASETGVIDFTPERVTEKGALRPGQIILVDTVQGRVMKDTEVKMALARKQPYRRWVNENRINIYGLFDSVAPIKAELSTLRRRQRLFGYTREDEKTILETMAITGQEPRGSMGSDQPLAVFSEKPQLLFWYFKQMFAQVTNPPIDPVREELVMTLMTLIGNPDSILTETPKHARLIKLQHPILSNNDLERIRKLNLEDFRSVELTTGFKAGADGLKLEQAVDSLTKTAVAKVHDGARIIIISDHDLPDDEAPMPILLAVSAVHQKLLKDGLRTKVGIIVRTGEAREVMHMALLLGYGASAINPYLAFETIAEMVENNKMDKKILVVEAIDNYVHALCKGLLKIMSKMGISTLRSYRNAQIFEAIGLQKSLVDKYFEGTPTRVEGIGLDGLAKEVNIRYDFAISDENARKNFLPSGGQYKYRLDGERHMWTAKSISLLQRATRENRKDLYDEFSEIINNQKNKLSTIRALFKFKFNDKPIPLHEVEPASEIVKRFVTGAMSFGSLSKETHETLAIAMNRLKGMSNSGEGGEDPERYKPLQNGDSKCSAVKQVASGRFGVTIEYLVHAREIQIKVAQGAKPGEGGHLPGHKVNKEIARVRHSTPGVTLISPPPHHDIYSIEDLAQLIYDLKNANPNARISVKLVSEFGVGTVAAGVAKAHADMILISGYDGGTGAAPLSSIKHAGAPWELGLAETQQTLVLNGLRGRVRLQTDGQIRTGRDVLVAALLGAEEYGFATAPLVVCGCVMMRKCHNNTCPVGVATQDPELRKRFSGKPEYLQNYFNMVAEELREYMARLGIRKVDQLIGRNDLLEMDNGISFWKAQGVELSRILQRINAPEDQLRCTISQNHGLEKSLDLDLLEKIEDAIEKKKKITIDSQIRNIHRTVGTMLSGKIANKHGLKGLPDDTITINFKGSAGQSFGAFLSKGVTLNLEGDANDYLGKGLSGGKIIVKPPKGSKFKAEENIIAGNVILYGATEGQVYINGQAGERFAIRNSGAHAVVEGVGDHGCEYMTRGIVVVLGRTGVNFGAGMSGGIAYVFDETGLFDDRCNLETIDLELLSDENDIKELRAMVENHLRYTGSERAKFILDNWQASIPYFIKVFPTEYKKILGQMSKDDLAVERKEDENE